METIARPPVVSQSEWDAALTAITEREEAVAAALHELAAARKRMPMVRVEHDYHFEGPDGRRSLPELFDGRSQLILYRFFFEEGVDGWPDAGCPGCSSVADGIPDLGLLHARDITFAMASPAPQANLRRYAERMGWTDVPWYTIRTERFSADFGVDEWFGFNVFLRDGDDVYRTYFLQHGPWSRASAASGACRPSRPTAGSPRTRTCRRAGRRRRGRSGSAVTTSSTIRRRRPAAPPTRTSDPKAEGGPPSALDRMVTSSPDSSRCRLGHRSGMSHECPNDRPMILPFRCVPSPSPECAEAYSRWA